MITWKMLDKNLCFLCYGGLYRENTSGVGEKDRRLFMPGGDCC